MTSRPGKTPGEPGFASVNYLQRVFSLSGMPRDPMSEFGALMSACVSDEYKKDRGLVRDGVVFALLGMLSSVVTTYALSMAGIFV